MRILHNFSVFSPSKGGGTVTLMYQLMKEQINQGHEVWIYAKEIDRDYANSLPKLLIARSIDYIEVFDIVHLHSQRSLMHPGLVYQCQKHKIPYIIDAHGDSSTKIGSIWKKKLYDFTVGRYIYPNCSHYIAQSGLGLREYESLGINSGKVSVVWPLPFPTHEFDNPITGELFRSEFNIPTDKKIVLSMGRLHKIKGIDRCIKGFAEALKTKDDIILVIAGEGPDLKRLSRLVFGSGIFLKVRFVGHLSGDLRISAFKAANVLIQTSLYEQEAWCPFEAVLCGTPIIVSKHTGAGEDVRRLDAGYTVDIDDPYKMGVKIRYVVDFPHEGKTKAMQAGNYLRQHATAERYAADVEKIYDSVLSR